MRTPEPGRTMLELPLSAIDEPRRAMRETFDEQELAALAESVKALGVLLPIIVLPRGKRYEIDDGHRRYLASVMAGKKTIPAIVSTAADGVAEAIKVHANLFREDVNPAEEAAFFQHLLTTHCEGDVDTLCKLTHLRRGYVEDRLLLIAGDPDVVAAVRGRKIGIGVARELQQVTDRGNRLMYLDAAVKGGATVRVVREWRLRANQAPMCEPPPLHDGTNQHTNTPPPTFRMECVCCGSDDAPWELELIYVHRRCRGMFLEPLLARVRGELKPEGQES